MFNLCNFASVSWFAVFSLSLSPVVLAVDEGIQLKKSSEMQTQPDMLVAGWESDKMAFGWIYEVPLIDHPDKMPMVLRSIYRQVAVGELVKNNIKFLPKAEELSSDRLDSQLQVQKITIGALREMSQETVAYRSYLNAKLKEFNARTDRSAIIQGYQDLGDLIKHWKKISNTSSSVNTKVDVPGKTIHAPIDLKSKLNQSQDLMSRSVLNEMKLALQRKDANTYLRSAKTLRHIIESPSFTQQVRDYTAAQFKIHHRVDGLLFDAVHGIDYSRLLFVSNAGGMESLALDATELLNYLYLLAGGKATKNAVLASLAGILYHMREGAVPFDEQSMKAVAAGSATENLKAQVATVLEKSPEQIDVVVEGAIL